MFFVVGVTETCKRLAICGTERQASEFIETLPAHEQGVYYIDPVGSADGPVVLSEVTSDDLPADLTNSK